MNEQKKITSIEWISPDEALPLPRQKVLILAPHMSIRPGNDWLEIIQCRISGNGFALVSDDGVLDWEVEDIMWWAEQPDWMDSPGWVKKC